MAHIIDFENGHCFRSQWSFLKYLVHARSSDTTQTQRSNAPYNCSETDFRTHSPPALGAEAPWLPKMAKKTVSHRSKSRQVQTCLDQSLQQSQLKIERVQKSFEAQIHSRLNQPVCTKLLSTLQDSICTCLLHYVIAIANLRSLCYYRQCPRLLLSFHILITSLTLLYARLDFTPSSATRNNFAAQNSSIRNRCCPICRSIRLVISLCSFSKFDNVISCPDRLLHLLRFSLVPCLKQIYSQNYRKENLREKKKLHNFAHHGNLGGIQKILELNKQFLNANLEVKAVFASIFSLPISLALTSIVISAFRRFYSLPGRRWTRSHSPMRYPWSLGLCRMAAGARRH